ncbi:hypothetical protein [Chitinimonas naiadis]
MQSLLLDWCAVCEGRAAFDKSHFLGLLKAHHSKEDLQRIFAYFPHSVELISRAENVVSAGTLEDSLYLLPKGGTDKTVLVQKGAEWLKEQEKVCILLGNTEIEEICHGGQVCFVSKSDLQRALQQDVPHYWLFDEIGDAIRASKLLTDEKTHALFEALYGLAADYYLAWYIGQPLFAFEIDLEPYFRLWQAGGKCVLTEQALLVSG